MLRPQSFATQVVRRLTTPPSISRSRAILLSERAAALQTVMASVEHLFNDAERRPGGVNDWRISRDSMRFRSATVRRLVDRISQPAATNAVHAARLAGAALLVTPWGGRRVRAAAGTFLVTSAHLLATRQHVGGDGSDHAAVVVGTLMSGARLAGDRTRVADVFLWTSALQAVLAYGVSGWVKVAGRAWRTHQAIPGIMRTRSYGNPHLHRLLERFPAAGPVIGVATLALECSFPLILAARGRLTTPYLLSAGSMHLSIAGVMGLGRFVPAFVSFYPALAYVTGRPVPTDAPRSDIMPKVATATGLALVAALKIGDHMRLRRLKATAPQAEQLVSPTGNVIDLHIHRNPDPAAPVVVLENGLMATVEMWEWFVRSLAEHATVVLHDPAGYGPTARTPPVDLRSRITDLRAVVDHAATHLARADQAGAAPLVLGGHSLGGYTASLIAAECPAVAALLLIDPTHPDELDRSPSQRVGAERLDDVISVSAWSVRAGLGNLVEPPKWVRLIPEEVRQTALDKYRLSGLWMTSAAEWRSAHDHFDTVPGLPEIRVPALVVAAEDTHLADVVMADLHAEYGASPGSRVEVIPAASHDGILLRRRHAEAAAGIARDFLDELVDATTRGPEQASTPAATTKESSR